MIKNKVVFVFIFLKNELPINCITISNTPSQNGKEVERRKSVAFHGRKCILQRYRRIKEMQNWILKSYCWGLGFGVPHEIRPPWLTECSSSSCEFNFNKSG